MTHYTYTLLLLFTLSYPLFKSFEDKVQFYKQWRSLFPAIFISAIIFIAWDMWFVKKGVWVFNPDYILGFYVGNLAIEECLFFFIVPFSCVFIYEVLNYFIKKDILAEYSKYISYALIAFSLVIAVMNINKLHTLVTFTGLGAFLIIHQFILRSAYLGRYYIAWAVCILPFLIVDGVLTAMPVLVYNNLENLNVRIYSIPVEDLFYGMLQLLMVVTVYEYLKQKRA